MRVGQLALTQLHHTTNLIQILISSAKDVSHNPKVPVMFVKDIEKE
jgi:hypothetical protein